MSLKYYAIERNRYGQMGAITPETAMVALNRAIHRFNLPRVVYEVSTRKRTRSFYRPGLHMFRPDGHRAKAMDVPKIVVAHTMQTWLTLVHELAHHWHCVKYDDRAKRAVGGSRPPREHWHGPQHRALVQILVDYFMEIDMIPEKPTYMKVAAELEAARNRPINPEIAAMELDTQPSI